MSKRPLYQLTPLQFSDALLAMGLDRGYVVFDRGELIASDPRFQDLVEYLRCSPDFARHEGVFFERGGGTGVVHWAFVHDTRRGAGRHARLTRLLQQRADSTVAWDVNLVRVPEVEIAAKTVHRVIDATVPDRVVVRPSRIRITGSREAQKVLIPTAVHVERRKPDHIDDERQSGVRRHVVVRFDRRQS